jgi:hypothetical protein
MDNAFSFVMAWIMTVLTTGAAAFIAIGIVAAFDEAHRG